MTIERILKHLGFTAMQVKIYLASLSLGAASAQHIARAAGVPRTTAYAVLDGLVERGVIGKTLVRKKTRFRAEPPTSLLATLKRVEHELSAILPELEARYTKEGQKPKILFYEGKGAVQKVYDDTLAEKPEEILEWNTDEYFRFDRYHVDPTYIAKRMKLGIRARRLAGAGSKWQTKHKSYDRSELSETVIVPRELFWPEVEVNIYGNKVAFLNYTEEMSLIIESKAIADVMRQAYELSWRGAKMIAVP